MLCTKQLTLETPRSLHLLAMTRNLLKKLAVRADIDSF
ncbi:hypothetical protein HFN_1213 [Helicobacter fennelliae MRY12-0050]|uniref:Uncharacterized protein n=1 Tax=Helicobacter fennelliae MRY12-0050 TaxID=1325130 RepID=T1CT03_9HELI|nr:hypothetical protein HFN_1213 [Helicobacter fennelliae MRY12-0050]